MAKRKRGNYGNNYSKRAKYAKRTGFKRKRRSNVDATQNKRIKRIERMIETKESNIHTSSNVKFRHNQVHVINQSGGYPLNPFEMAQGTGDPMAMNAGQRIGDMISVKGLLVRGFFENALSRSKVYYRLMLVKCAKGDTIDRTTLFKNDSNNKMIDQINTERFTVIAQKIFNIQPPQGGYAASGVDAVGVPTGVVYAGLCTRTIKMWIPGKKFGRSGTVQYENGSTTQVKFFDYRLVILCYDWYGTPQDVNDVGGLNELYTKLYFKDA